MTTDAVVGRVARDLPYLWIEWLCVEPCGAPVALARLAVGQRKIETKMVQFLPVRWPEADRDGLPYFGPSRREIRGKSSRRHPGRLAQVAQRRQLDVAIAQMESAWADAQTAAQTTDRDLGLPKVHADYAPIEAETFDTVCTKCATRLRIRIANALADAVSS